MSVQSNQTVIADCSVNTRRPRNMSSDQTTMLRINLDHSSPVPLYHQMAKAIEKDIETGTLTPGERLENEIALARRLRVSRPTARRALQELVDLGMLVRKRGVGTQVAPARVHRRVDLTSLFDDLSGSGRSPTTTVLEYSVGPGSPEISNVLEIPLGAEVVTVRRLRYADGEPLALMNNHLAIEIHMAQQNIGARTATAAEARILDEKPKAALLTMERTAYDATGRAIEHGIHVYRASRYNFSTTLFAQ